MSLNYKHLFRNNTALLSSHGVKSSKYGVFSGPYFPVFGLNTGKYGPEKTPYLDTSHAVSVFLKSQVNIYTQ